MRPEEFEELLGTTWRMARPEDFGQLLATIDYTNIMNKTLHIGLHKSWCGIMKLY
jgi:hypothetical protein